MTWIAVQTGTRGMAYYGNGLRQTILLVRQKLAAGTPTTLSWRTWTQSFSEMRSSGQYLVAVFHHIWSSQIPTGSERIPSSSPCRWCRKQFRSWSAWEVWSPDFGVTSKNEARWRRWWRIWRGPLLSLRMGCPSTSSSSWTRRHSSPTGPVDLLSCCSEVVCPWQDGFSVL